MKILTVFQSPESFATNCVRYNSHMFRLWYCMVVWRLSDFVCCYMKLPILQVSLIKFSRLVLCLSLLYGVFTVFGSKSNLLTGNLFSMCTLTGLSNITMVYHSYLVPSLRFLLSKYTHPYPSECRVTSCYGIHVLLALYFAKSLYRSASVF